MGKTKTSFVSEEKEQNKKSNKTKPEKLHISGLKGGQKIKMIETEQSSPDPSVSAEGETKDSKKKALPPKARGKSYKLSLSKIDKTKMYNFSEAVKLLKDLPHPKFDETYELHIIVRKTGLSAQVTLPHPFGKEKKVEIATDETVKKLTSGKIDFDVLLSTPDMMPKLVPFARLLGPRGLMPNAKNGTLIQSSAQAKGFSTSSKTLKTEKEAPLIHTTVGKVSQDEKQVNQNIEEVFRVLGGNKQILKAYLKCSMSPSVKLNF